MYTYINMNLSTGIVTTLNLGPPAHFYLCCCYGSVVKPQARNLAGPDDDVDVVVVFAIYSPDRGHGISRLPLFHRRNQHHERVRRISGFKA
jgi:hypothetical protein